MIGRYDKLPHSANDASPFSFLLKKFKGSMHHVEGCSPTLLCCQVLTGARVNGAHGVGTRLHQF